MSIPQFTVTKGAKSATFRVQNIDFRSNGAREVPVEGGEEGETEMVEGNPRLILYPELGILDPMGTEMTWNADQSNWPKKVKESIRTFDGDAVEAAKATLGSALQGKTIEQVLVMIAVQCFDTANGTSSTINWGD